MDIEEDLQYNIPPIEIKFSDINISTDNEQCENAIKALKGYWSQATVMTQREQKEYQFLLTQDAAYKITKSGEYCSGHKVYRRIQTQPTWSRWVFLKSLYSDLASLHEIIEATFQTLDFDDHTSEYEKYFSTELPVLAKNLKTDRDANISKNLNSGENGLGKGNEDSVQTESYVEKQSGPKRDTPDNAQRTSGNQESIDGGKEIEEQRRPTKKGKEIAVYRESSAGPSGQFLIPSKRSAELDQDKSKKRLRGGVAESKDHLIEKIANKGVQLVGDSIDKKFNEALTQKIREVVDKRVYEAVDKIKEVLAKEIDGVVERRIKEVFDKEIEGIVDKKIKALHKCLDETMNKKVVGILQKLASESSSDQE